MSRVHVCRCVVKLVKTKEASVILRIQVKKKQLKTDTYNDINQRDRINIIYTRNDFFFVLSCVAISRTRYKIDHRNASVERERDRKLN